MIDRAKKSGLTVMYSVYLNQHAKWLSILNFESWEMPQKACMHDKLKV